MARSGSCGRGRGGLPRGASPADRERPLALLSFADLTSISPSAWKGDFRKFAHPEVASSSDYWHHTCSRKYTRSAFERIPRTREDRAMILNPYYSPEFHGDYDSFDLGDFVLEEGYTLRDCKLAYTTFGGLNAAKENATPL